jgi:hypothetical protein
MRTLRLVAAVIALAVAIPMYVSAADAQERDQYYKSSYFLTGIGLRASKVCNDTKLADYGSSLIGSAEFRAFSAAHPKTVEKWMREGGELFNRGVMNDGVSEACGFVRSRFEATLRQ